MSGQTKPLMVYKDEKFNKTINISKNQFKVLLVSLYGVALVCYDIKLTTLRYKITNSRTPFQVKDSFLEFDMSNELLRDIIVLILMKGNLNDDLFDYILEIFDPDNEMNIFDYIELLTNFYVWLLYQKFETPYAFFSMEDSDDMTKTLIELINIKNIRKKEENVENV